MVVTVRLFATLRDNRKREMSLELGETSTPGDIMKSLNIPESEVAILLVNGRDGQTDQSLSHGDVVSLFPPVGGG